MCMLKCGTVMTSLMSLTTLSFAGDWLHVEVLNILHHYDQLNIIIIVMIIMVKYHHPFLCWGLASCGGFEHSS